MPMESNALIYLHSGSDTSAQSHSKTVNRVYFLRQELGKILNVYGRMVSAGIWKDYAIDQLKDVAIFSIHRRTGEVPRYSIIKEPALAAKQGQWRITSMNGQIVKRGKNLDHLLRYFDNKILKDLK
ncbi:hypothetical protein GCM10017044_00570 [Kordiimonas sediminis]|uniref:DUF2794 domain-containing protein n=1 Tax=Kordiimonas sediminis TaxID=1735581 RepID=A0A919AJP8_9PROT|nr:DUF2794 domain-containing protein [Kordiimonas sediminis]GHF10773.1 hypothetical protein GCM10017044_00570 [Kordiimonas sediminis]